MEGDLGVKTRRGIDDSWKEEMDHHIRAQRTAAYSLTYSAQTHLAHVTQNGQATMRYLYDALGQRVGKDPLAGGTDTHAVYD